MTDKRCTTALIILDGFGYREESEANAIAGANKPVWDKLWANKPHTLVSGSGNDVGLPHGQMGNSEVGHMNLGAGRVVYQELTRISKAIKDGDFYTNEVLVKPVQAAVQANKAVHIMGLMSPGGVHSHESHLHAMVDLAVKQGATKIYVHAFLDGRDTPPRSAEKSLAEMDAKLKELGVGRIASIIGRYFAMDRDKRWDRVQSAYDLLTQGKAEFTASTAVAGLKTAYERDENDEFVKATAIVDKNNNPAFIEEGDAVIFMNFRADRARQLTQVFVDSQFAGFEREVVRELAGFVMLTQYSADLAAPSAYPPAVLKNGLGEYLANQGKTQLRIAETEKYAHVTFFFSCGREEPYEGETRILVNSPKVATYDLQPEMSAPEVTDKLVDAINSGQFDLVVCNYANGDMVGHTGDYDAAVKAIECLDECVGRVVAALEEVNGQCLITADHGNAELMLNQETGQAHTAHTTELVPLVYCGPKQIQLQDAGVLSDIAPSLLDLMGITQPEEMSGKSLIKH